MKVGRRRLQFRLRTLSGWLCRGLSYNLHLPAMVLSQKMEFCSDQHGVW